MTTNLKSQRLVLIGIFLFLFFLIIVPFGLIVANIYCQRVGLPKAIEKKILGSLKEKGIITEVSKIKAGLFSGIILENLVISDFEIPSWKLFSAENVHIRAGLKGLLAGELDITEVEVSEGSLSIPLSMEKDSPTFEIQHLSCQIENLQDEFKINSLMGNLDRIKIHLDGNLIKPTEKELDLLRRKGRPEFLLSIYPWLPRLLPALTTTIPKLEHLQEAMGKDSKVEISGNFGIPIVRITESNLMGKLTVTQLLYRGLNIETFVAEGDLNFSEMIIREFRLNMDNQEYLQGNALVNLSQKIISSHFSFLGYPYKLVKAFCPTLIPQENAGNFPDFFGAPMKVNATLHPSPLFQPKNWDLDLKLEVADLRIRKGLLQSLQGDFILKERILSFKNVHSQLSPNIEIEAQGEFHLDQRVLGLKAQVDGDPNFVSQFVEHAQFQRINERIWKDFQWTIRDRPHFDVQILYDESFKKPSIFFHIHSTMGNVIYNGVSLDSASGDVTLDVSGKLLVIDNLEVTKGEEKARADIVWDAKKGRVDFSALGNISPSNILCLVNPRFKESFDNIGYSFGVNPEFLASGQVSKEGNPKYKINVDLRSPSLKYKNASMNEVRVSMEILDSATKFDSTIHNLQYEDYILSQVTASGEITTENSRISGIIKHSEGKGMSIHNTDYLAVTREGSSEVDSTSEKMVVGLWDIKNITANSIYSDNEIRSKAMATNAEFQDFTFTGISSDFFTQEGNIHSDFTIAEINYKDEFTLRGIQSKGGISSEHLDFSGVIGEFLHYSTKGVSRDIQATCKFSSPVFEMSFKANGFGCPKVFELNEINGKFMVDNSGPSGEYNVGQAFWKEQIKAEKIIGKFGKLNESWYLNNNWETIEFPDFSLDNVTTKGAYSENGFNSSLFAETFHIEDYLLQELTATLLLKEENLSISRITSNFYGGKLTGEFFYNYVQQNGKLWLTAFEADFGKLLHFMNSEPSDPVLGKFSSKVDLNFDHKEADLRLFGNGKLLIEQGNFWRVPLISDFLQAIKSLKIMNKVVPYGDLSEIKELRSDFEFQENKINFTNTKTDGSLVAISAEGYYWWEGKELDFRVLAKPLNPFFSMFLPRAIDPFAILLERRLKGKISDPRWEEISAIRDFFRPKENETIEPSH